MVVGVDVASLGQYETVYEECTCWYATEWAIQNLLNYATSSSAKEFPQFEIFRVSALTRNGKTYRA